MAFSGKAYKYNKISVEKLWTTRRKIVDVILLNFRLKLGSMEKL